MEIGNWSVIRFFIKESIRELLAILSRKIKLLKFHGKMGLRYYMKVERIKKYKLSFNIS